jgi:hypothetical protein
MPNLANVPRPETLATSEDIRRLLGDTENVLEILSLSPSVTELEEAQAWLEGQGDFLARRGRPQTPTIAAILDIVEPDEEPAYLR